MSQMIIRIYGKQDCEVLKHSSVENENLFKKISIEALISILSKEFDDKSSKPMMASNESIVGWGKNICVINQPAHKRIVTYNSKAYNINFPNSIYIVKMDGNRVYSITAFAYLKYEGIATELYKYPMPNMLSGDKICIGSADTSIKDGDVVQTLENIIYTQYSHSSVNNVKSFKNTVDYFEYLSEKELDSTYLIKRGQTLRHYVDIF